MVSMGAEFWAWRAYLWGSAPYPADPSRTNFDEACRRIVLEAQKPGKVLLMRNQATTGMNNNYWPAVSRWAVMRHPWLAAQVHPKWVDGLDGAEGLARMRQWYRMLTGEAPRANSWKEAVLRVEAEGGMER